MLNQLQTKNCFFYNESYFFYFKTVLKSLKIELIYKFIFKVHKKLFLFLPSLILTFYSNFYNITHKLSKEKKIIFENYMSSFVNNNYFLTTYINTFKSNLKKNFHLHFLTNKMTYLYKSVTKGFKKILKVFGIVIDFHYI